MSKKVLALFSNRTQALNFARNLNRINIKTRIVNSPRELTASCGLSVQFDYKELNKVKQFLNSYPAHTLAGFYITANVSGVVRYVKV